MHFFTGSIADRGHGLTITECIISCFCQLSNESVNVLSHLVPGTYFAVKAVGALADLTEPPSQLSTEHVCESVSTSLHMTADLFAIGFFGRFSSISGSFSRVFWAV